jgi:hypothetical protein
MDTFIIYNSDKPEKKFVVVTPSSKRVYFGASGYEDYTIHKDADRKMRYIQRHQRREDWTDSETAGFWSRWILWNRDSFQKSIENTSKRFGIVIRNQTK